MKSFEYTIKDEIGIHARPAGMLIKEAARFSSDIKITNVKTEKETDAKKLFGVMGLAVKCGDTVRITIEGIDEEEAQKSLEEFFKNNL